MGHVQTAARTQPGSPKHGLNSLGHPFLPPRVCVQQWKEELGAGPGLELGHLDYHTKCFPRLCIFHIKLFTGVLLSVGYNTVIALTNKWINSSDQQIFTKQLNTEGMSWPHFFLYPQCHLILTIGFQFLLFYWNYHRCEVDGIFQNFRRLCQDQNGQLSLSS